MSILISDFKAVRKDLLVLLFIAFLVEFLLELVLFKIPELFTGAAVIGQMISKLALSYIASFVFYFLVVHMKSQRDKRNVYAFVLPMAKRIGYDARSIVTEIKINKKIKLSEDPSKEEIQAIFGEITFGTQVNMVVQIEPEVRGNWLMYLIWYYKRLNECLEGIYPKAVFVDSDFIHKLMAIEECAFIKSIGMFSNMPNLHLMLQDQTLTSFSAPFAEYLRLIKNLETYIEKKCSDLEFNEE